LSNITLEFPILGVIVFVDEQHYLMFLYLLTFTYALNPDTVPYAELQLFIAY